MLILLHFLLRLVFLVQIVTQYLEGIFLSERAPSANGKKKTHFGSSMSIGLAVKKFWNKTAHIQHTVKMMKKKVILVVFICLCIVVVVVVVMIFMVIMKTSYTLPFMQKCHFRNVFHY